MNPARAAAPGEGRRDVAATGSAGAQEVGRDCAGRVRSVSARWPGADGTAVPATTESRKAGSVSARALLATTRASVGFMDAKPRA